MSDRRRAGIAALAIGLGLVLGVRLVPGLGGPPLYDGVVAVGPYLWLSPGPGQQGGAEGARATVAVIGGRNDIVALATGESLPQAQVLAIPGALILPLSATSLSVSIEPVSPSGQPTDGTLGSNVYRFEVKDQNGAGATARSSAKVSIVLRSADAALLTGIVERWDGSAWAPLKTAPPDVGGAYLAVVTEFGDYAVVKPGAVASSGASGAPGASATTSASGGAPSASASPTPIPGGDTSGGLGLGVPIFAAAGIALAVLVVLLALTRRPGPPPAPPPKRGPKEPPYRGAHRKDRD